MPDIRAPASDDQQLTNLKLAALAEFAAGAGHEINNPLATIIGYAQQLLANESDPDRRNALATIGAQAYRIRDMIGDVMLFARPPEACPETLDLSLVAREVIDKLSAEARDAEIDIRSDLSSAVAIFADPVQLRVVISSLLRNSLESLEVKGRVLVTVRSVDEGGRRWARLTFADTGRSLTAAEAEHLFDPFFSGRQAGRGLGFGLPKAWRIVTLHGGRIEVDSPATGGVKFVITWPAARA
jgi:signal transduction histidine kinase